MDSIYAWLTAENENIELDPTFLIDGVPAARQRLPWESLTIEGDTARIEYDRAHPDIVTPYNIYAHLHLMKRMNRVADWLPDYAGDARVRAARRGDVLARGGVPRCVPAGRAWRGVCRGACAVGAGGAR
jgi:hypothetical protein